VDRLSGVDLNIVGFNIDKTITETYTSNEELANVAGSIPGIGCCCGDQRTNETFDAHIHHFYIGIQVSIYAIPLPIQFMPESVFMYFIQRR
jgi:hypothetical protein